MAYNRQGSCSSPTSISPPMQTLLASSASPSSSPSLCNQCILIGPEVEDGRVRPMPMKRFKRRRCQSSVFFPLHGHAHRSETTASKKSEDINDDDNNNNIEDVRDGTSPSEDISPTLSILSPSVSSSSTITIPTVTTTTTNRNSNTKDMSDGTSPSEETSLVFKNISQTLSSSLLPVYSSSAAAATTTTNNVEDVSDDTTSPSEEISLGFTYTSPTLPLFSSASSSSSSSSYPFAGETFQELEWPLSIHEKDGDAFGQASDPSSCYNPLDNMDSLRIFLPLKRGLSRYYIGKSQSLTSFDAIDTIFDLAKSDYRSLKKLRIIVQ